MEHFLLRDAEMIGPGTPSFALGTMTKTSSIEQPDQDPSGGRALYLGTQTRTDTGNHEGADDDQGRCRRALVPKVPLCS